MKSAQTLLIAAAMLFTTVTHAALESRLDGLAIYDTDLNITWLQDASYAQTSGYDVDGGMTWHQANTWASSLSIGGISGWRLPDIYGAHHLDICNFCFGSELAHLFYDEMGGEYFSPIHETHNANYYLFQNVRSNLYWLATGNFPVGMDALAFSFEGGAVGYFSNSSNFSTWAVHDGDVAVVPVPTAAWLLGSGLLGLVGVARRKEA